MELTQRLLLLAHCGRNGHRGMHVMENHIHRLFYIGGLSGIVRDFCSKCLLCLHVKGGVVVPRPFSEIHHTFERNTTLHWEFCTLGECFGSSRYVLVLRMRLHTTLNVWRAMVYIGGSSYCCSRLVQSIRRTYCMGQRLGSTLQEQRDRRIEPTTQRSPRVYSSILTVEERICGTCDPRYSASTEGIGFRVPGRCARLALPTTVGAVQHQPLSGPITCTPISNRIIY